MTIWWNEVTKGWNEVAWNEVAWNEVAWNEVVMERSDQIPNRNRSINKFKNLGYDR